MTLHAQHATSGHALRELQETEPHPVITAGMLARPRDELLDAQVEIDRQMHLVVNATPEIDSLIEVLVDGLSKGADISAVVADAVPLARELYESQGRGRRHVWTATGDIDLMSRTQHTSGIRTALSIKGAADRLRGPLRVLKRAETEMVPAREIGPAYCAFRDVASQLPVETLRGSALRNKLGKGPHDVLLSLLTDGETEADHGV